MTTIQISNELYRRIQRLAAQSDQPVDAVLEEILALAEQNLSSGSPEATFLLQVDDEDVQMDREEAAYRTLHEQLMKDHLGEFVAIRRGEVVDHDKDEFALLARMNKKFPDEIVLIKQVRPLPERILHFRSPQLPREKT